MDTAKYKALLTAADCGSLSRAAEELGYTQSGLTHMMNALEEETGVPFLVRGNRGVTLSTEGRRLSPVIRELLSAEERLEQELALTRGVERGRVRIGAYSSISLRWLPQIIERYQQLYPNVELELLEGNGEEIEEWLSSGRVDIAYMSLQPHYVFDMLELRRDPMLAVLPKNHPMAGAKEFPVELFAGEPFLALTTTSGPDEDLAQAMKLAGIDEKAKFSSTYDQNIISMVAHNLGVTIMPELIVEGRTHEVATVPLSPALTRSLGIAARSFRGMSPAMERLVACTKEFFPARTLPKPAGNDTISKKEATR